MQDPVPVAHLQTPEGHLHPRLDVPGEEEERLVSDEVLEVGGEELED